MCLLPVILGVPVLALLFTGVFVTVRRREEPFIVTLPTN
jgi:hypothetical protein